MKKAKVKQKRQCFNGLHTTFYHEESLTGKVKIIVSNIDDDGDGDDGKQTIEVHGEDILALVLHILKRHTIQALENIDILDLFKRKS